MKKSIYLTPSDTELLARLSQLTHRSNSNVIQCALRLFETQMNAMQHKESV